MRQLCFSLTIKFDIVNIKYGKEPISFRKRTFGITQDGTPLVSNIIECSKLRVNGLDLVQYLNQMSLNLVRDTEIDWVLIHI